MVQRKRKALFYSISTTTLIENRVSKIEGLQVLYQGRRIDSILITTLHLWNGGNTLLTPESFYPNNNLSIVLNDASELLGVELVSESADTCKSYVYKNDNRIYVHFDFLEPKQGIVLNIYHTYVKENPIVIIGKMIEGNIVNKTIEIENKIEAVHISTRLFDIKVDNPFYNFFVGLCDILGVRVKSKKK